jgi:hypothetical protein
MIVCPDMSMAAPLARTCMRRVGGAAHARPDRLLGDRTTGIVWACLAPSDYG